MLTYDNQRCEYCGKAINKITQLHKKAEKTNHIPETLYLEQKLTTENKIRCKTCRHEISTKTIQCPSCGEIKFWKLIKLSLSVMAFFAIMQIILGLIVMKIMGF